MSSSARSMRDVIRSILILDVVFGLICPLFAVAPDYEFDLHLYQQNISWLQCPEGWTNFGIKCFKIFTDKASFEESEINCKSYGGHLIHIDRLNKNLLLGERALNEGVQEAAWLGFWREVNGSYHWTNDEFGDKNLAFWVPGQPQVLHDDLKLCTYMIINSGTNQYRWVLDRCEVKRGFICEMDACVFGDFRCGSGQCVSPHWRCDGKPDCPDGRDEQNCGTDSCGGFVEGFQITYPNQVAYKPWLNCQWKVRAPIGYKVKLQFTHLDTEPMYDVVGVYDGLTTQTRLIGNFSGQDIPPAVTSTTNFLLVTLTTDHSTERTGFSAKWSSVLSLCDSSLETLEADNEIKWVTSPGYPEYYSDNLQCSWIIRAVREEHVTLKVIDVDLLPADWLEIRDGASRESTLIHRYSGRVQNDVLVSSGRHFYLHLHTDLKGSGTGFNISYHSGCDVTISGGFGRISSPGFHAGNRYPNNLQCSWTLQDINNRPSTLTFNFFHTETSYDFVQIYNATTISSETLLLNISGSHSMLESLRSPIGHFIVHFQTDNLVNKAGWSASFSFDCHDDTPLPENLSVTSSRAGYQSYITYSCDKGYRLEGTNKRFCDKAGIWNSTVPVCKLINCGVPLPLLNGVLLNVTSRNYDGVGYYRCNPGHGDTDIVYKVTCLDQGWIGIPSCSPMECPKLKAVPNGIIHSPYLYRIHARANFKCHSGYRIKGHMTSECLHGGHWSRPEPICVPINSTLCVEVKVIHGSINQTGPIMVGETIHITCKDGYQLYPAGLDSITCMESGQYDQQIPQCADIDECQSDKTCGSQHTCHNIGGGFWCECTEGYQHTDIEDPLCEDIDECSVNNGNCEQACVNTEGGYQCTCSGVSRLYTGNQTQLINGRLLVPGQSCYVVCENQSIERSERLIYTTTPLPDGSYLYPTSLHIVCPHGAFPDGPPLVTCKQDGTWSADVDKCIVRQCDHLDDLEKGDIVFTSNREAGSFANYTCHQGYSLHGNRSRFCHAMVDYQGDVTLVWTGKQPVCEPVDCHTPPSVRNGNVSYPSTRFKNIAIYSCNHGYKLKDVSYRKCLFSGLWSTDEIICVAQTCPWLQPPLAGSLTSNSTWYGDGAVESFKCNAGYQLSDTSPLLCYIPEPFPDDVASTSLPHLEFDVSFTVYSSEALDKIKQNCSIHYSQELQGRLDGTIKRLIPYSKCAWPSDAGSVITHKDITLNTTNKTTTHEVVIKKKVSIYPAHTLLPSPVRGEEDCFSVLDRRDVLYLPNNSVCERTVTSKLEILEPVELVCKNGVPVQQDDVTFCMNIKQGPVFMLQVDFILRTTTPVTNTCSIRLRERVRVGVNDMVNTMRFDEKCPGLNNPVLTNTSGSVQIGDEKIEVKIPFFLHDNTSPFHEVQQCGSAIQEAITSTFKDVIKAMVQQLNVKCTNISFSFADSDFTIPVTQEICQVQYEFDNSSSKCVFCGSCGSLDTTTSTTTSTTTPAPLSSSSSTTTSSTQPASLVTSTTELSTSALTSSVASTDPSPSSSASETVSTTSDTVSTTSDKVTTTSDKVTTTSDTVSTTIDTVSTTSETVSTTSDKVSTTSDKVSTTSDKVTTTSDTVSTTIDTVSTTSDKVSTTSEAISTTSDKVSTTSDAISTTTDSSSESTSSTTAEITTSTPSPSSTTISGEQTTSTSPERTSSSTTQATTTPSLAGCSNRTNSVNEVVVSDLDLSVQQTNLLWTSTFQVDNSDQFCIELYESRMKKLISIQEVQINSFLNIKTKCTDEGTYVRYTNLEMTAAGNTVTLKIAASLTRIAGVQFSSVSDSTISKCIGAMVGLPEFSQMKCLCFSSVLKSGSNLCPPVLLTNTMSFTRQIKSCDQGWSYLNNICVQDTPPTTASFSTTALTTTATSSIQTTTTEAAPTTTSNGVIEETTMAGMHECYICDLDGASSNAECVNMFESCTMENPVCMTQVTYQGKSGQYTLQKACSAQKDCERERTNTAGLCDRGKTSPYCVYCCNTSKCNLNVELLTFKGRRKRSAEDSIPPLIAQWNNTAPVCKDEERPMFNNCPSGMIVVNDSILPVSVNVQIPTAVDNSGIKPSITISPTNFTTPYWIYHSTNITFTATDGAGLVAECVVIIQVKDMTPPTLNCPRNTLKVYKDITEETAQIDYADITANLSDMVDLNSFQRRSMTPDMTDTVSVLEEFLVTLAVWDHANNSATCSFLMMYIPLGCPLWTLGSPLNVNLTWLSPTTVKAQCNDNSIMVHSGNASAVMEYTCEQHAMWTPTVFTPDCIPADLSVCPEWIYNVSWMVTPNSFMSIQPQCDITGSLTAQIHGVLNTLNVNIDILLIQNSTHNGIITVTSSFKMTSNNLIPAVCPSVRQVQGHLDNLNVSSLCQGSAILTNVTILGIQMDCASGLALMENNQEGGLCWPCPRGMAAKTAVCELCPIGTYRDNLKSTVCSPCPGNKSTKNNGSMSLSDCKEFCPLGWFSPSGLAPCIQCQPGTYQGGTGGKSCSSCKPGFGSSKYGSTMQTECKAQCGENEYSSTGFEPCVSCPYGYYNNQTQSTRCYRCTELTSSFLSCSESCGGFLCGDHGTCITGAQGDRCHCEPTHTGKQCDTPLSLCDEVLCQNGGTCEATNNSFVCSCMPGYNGVLCETKLAACYSSPCLNGLCKLTQDSFICQCYQGFKGRLCDQRENRCVNHKCQHGQCISLLEGYLCNCTGSGYYGEFCDSMEEHCQEGNCLNGGRCVNALNGFSCTCPSDYEGLVCEKKKDLCTESFCLNGGQCVTDIAGQTSCICTSGYSGDTCQTDDQLCQVNPCQNQGTCVRYQDKTTCQCKQGFSGEYCEFPLTIGCEEEPCDHDNSLECLGSDEGVTCICKSGWKGKYCEELDDLCQSNPCQNGGECENHGAHFTCMCLQGYAGNHCQDDVDECRSDPCMNGGNCTDQPGGYTCKCSPHFYGDTCHREIDGCVSNPCVHGTCLDAIEGYHCLCHHDWTGTQCDEAVNKCLSLPCENGGSCHQNGTEFTCTCQPRYTGMLCESELKPCEPNPCNNGGVCTGMSVAFTCTCPSGYHGDTCDLVVNVCDMVQCEHGGTCVEEDTGGRCVCTSLYTGQHCEKEKSADFDLTVTDEVSVVCETELGLEELTALTLCLTYRAAPTNDGFGYSRGLILKAMDEMNETLLAVSADKLEISFWNDSRPVVVEFGQLGIAWHQICLTWSSLTGQWSVYVDQRLQDQALNYGTERNLSQFKLSTRQPTTPLFQGQITGVNVYRTVLDIGDLHRCTHGNRGDVISWAMFDQCQSEADGVSVTYPSACPSSHCLPGYKGDQCNTLLDKSPPVVEYCPDDMVNVITVDELRTVVTWNEPVFYDNIAVVQINQTYYSGDVFTYGEYQVIYMAFDAADNHASCLFHVIVTSGHCKIPPHPLNGQRSCDAQGHSFTHCSISCLDPSLYQFTEEPAQLYICREAGVWDPPRGKQFTFPPCAGYSAPSQSYQGIILLKDQTCSESVKLNLIHQLQQQFYQTGLCETEDCQTSSVIVDCVIVNSRKRSTEPVQYKVTFNIPSPSYSIINSTAITDSFEQFVKEGMVNYTVEDFTMEVQLQCASGQVLSADKEFCVNCGKGYYFSSDSRQCELCPLGSFSAAERQMSCTSCDITQSTLTEGSTSQEDCFYICDVGYYLLDGECEPCEVGYYEDRTGSTQCKPCRLGYTTLTNASTHSSQCYFPCDMIGYTMSPEGSCVPCPRGWYKAERFDVACRPCPTGFTTLDVGAGSENLCTLVVCSPGYWRNDENKCDPCPIGTYQNDPGQDFCHRCPPGYTTSETGGQSLEACIRGEVDECLLQTDDCPDKSVCKDTEESFECQCILGYTKMQDGSCIDNCLDVCIHGDCEYDSAGNPVCKCHDDYQGLKCDDEAGGLSAGSIIGISVAVLFAVVLLAFLVFVCLRQKSSVKGTERQLLRFPIHRSDLRSSFRAIALAMNPFESSTERTVSTVLKGNRRKSKMSNTNTSGNFSNKSSSPSKTSYF